MKSCDCTNRKDKKNKESKAYGLGLVDFILNKLPQVEYHIPGGYQFCGPNTQLEARLARGDPGINKLDRACKDHDIAYSATKNSKSRIEADKALVARALPRIYSKDSKLSERAAALLVTGLMGAKIGLSKIGLGLSKKKKKNPKSKSVITRKKMKKSQRRHNRRRRSVKVVKRKKKTVKKSLKRKSISFGKLVHGARAGIKKSKIKSSSLNDTIKAGIRSAKDLKRNKTVKISRVLKLPKFGGSVLPILPILSALSAIGSISSSAVGVVKAIKNIESAKENMHGKTEKKIGTGLYLTQNVRGSGFFLKPFRQC